MVDRIMSDFVRTIYKWHEYFNSINDLHQWNFTDKQMHFYVIGLLGLAALLVVYPLFKLLSRHFIVLVAFIYVFTLMVGLTLAIELGQWYSGVGTMEFGDIVSGIRGFLFFAGIFLAVHFLLVLFWKVIHPGKKEKGNERPEQIKQERPEYFRQETF